MSVVLFPPVTLLPGVTRLSARLLKKEEKHESGNRMVTLARTDGLVGGVDACQVYLVLQGVKLN